MLLVLQNSKKNNIIIITIIIIIERRDFGGIMSKDCKHTLQTQNKTVRVRCSRTSEVSEQRINKTAQRILHEPIS